MVYRINNNFYILAPIIKELIERSPAITFFSVIVLCLSIRYIDKPQAFTDYLLLSRLFVAIDRLPVFVLGMCMYRCIDLITKKLVIVFGVIMLLGAMITKMVPVPSLIQDYNLLLVCLATPGVSLLCGKASNVMEIIHLRSLFIWFGKNSLYIYLTHEFVYWSFFHYLQSLGGFLSFFLSLVVVYTLVSITNITTECVIKR